MPYINIRASKTFTDDQKKNIIAQTGKLVELLPGKSEPGLMMEVCGGRDLHFGGQPVENGAFIEVRLLGASTDEGKDKFNAAMCAMLREQAGLNTSEIYLNYLEFMCWGSKGEYKKL